MDRFLHFRSAKNRMFCKMRKTWSPYDMRCGVYDTCVHLLTKCFNTCILDNKNTRLESDALSTNTIHDLSYTYMVWNSSLIIWANRFLAKMCTCTASKYLYSLCYFPKLSKFNESDFFILVGHSTFQKVDALPCYCVHGGRHFLF